MSYITTVTGKHFYPLNPDQQNIDIEDIAHALSLICRANGHFRHFYSVAQHSLACAEEAAARGHSLAVVHGCLLHDASEAYLCDVTRPVKKHIPAYLQAEEKLQAVIWKHFIGRELTEAEQAQIFEIDDHILSMEFHLLMPEDLNEDYRKLQSDCACAPQAPAFECAGILLHKRRMEAGSCRRRSRSAPPKAETRRALGGRYF